MTANDKVKLKIHIGPEWLNVTIPFSLQDEARETEAHVASLYDKWHKEYPSKSPQELLAMLAYQYASYFLASQRSEARSLDALKDADARLDSLLKSI